jgi:hypothetical protein
MSYPTEEETEHWFEEQTRKLTMPDGSTILFTETKLAWRSLDYVTETSNITEGFLIELAVDWGKEENLDFKITFPNMCVYAHRELRWQRGID